MNNRVILLIVCVLLSKLAFADDDHLKGLKWSEVYSEELFHLTEVMVTDVSSPPVAARIYAYGNLASFLVMKESGINFRSPEFLSSTYLKVPDFSSARISSPEFSAIYAMLLVGEKIMPSGYLLKERMREWEAFAIKSRILKKKELPSHILYAKEISDWVISIANNDGYLQLSTLARYSPTKEKGRWYPTPPAYMSAVEPEWKTIQPFFLKNLDSFSPEEMAPFDLDPKSSFKIQLEEIIEVTSNLSEEQTLIANFWDCNPFMVDFTGHMAIGIKKISPGGHWMGITGIAAIMDDLSFHETTYIHTLVALTLHDAFISCWKAKYETDRIRPETIINEEIDRDWKPLLQTPPFPEYTSGHSVISRASAVVLTKWQQKNSLV